MRLYRFNEKKLKYEKVDLIIPFLIFISLLTVIISFLYVILKEDCAEITPLIQSGLL